MDIIKAIEMAIQNERKTKQQYEKLLRLADIPSTKMMFKKLVEQEINHERGLAKELKAIKNIKSQIREVSRKHGIKK